MLRCYLLLRFAGLLNCFFNLPCLPGLRTTLRDISFDIHGHFLWFHRSPQLYVIPGRRVPSHLVTTPNPLLSFRALVTSYVPSSGIRSPEFDGFAMYAP